MKTIGRMTRRQEAFRDEFRPLISRYYSGGLHVAMITAIGIGVIWLSVSRVSEPRWFEFLVIPLALLGANLFEWALHRYVMHRPIHGYGGFFLAIYKRHTLAHHQFFTHTEPSVDTSRDFRIVFFPPYAYVTLLLLVTPLAVLLGVVGFDAASWLLIATAGAIYMNYELFHYCCHVKNDRLVRRLPLVNTIRRHHIAHHDPRSMMRENFNLTYPFADWLFGTSDLDAGPIRHLFNGYRTSARRGGDRRVVGSADDPGAGLVAVSDA